MTAWPVVDLANPDRADRSGTDETALATALSSALDDHDSAPGQKVRVLRAIADATESLGRSPRCRIVPFAPGRRPTDERAHPGMGASDCAALVTGGNDPANRAIMLFEASAAEPAHAVAPRLGFSATVRPAEHDGSTLGTPLAEWDERPVEQRPDGAVQNLVLHPETDFTGVDLGFEHAYLRRAAVNLVATWDGIPVAGDQAWVDVCDVRNLGGLYQRLIERLLVMDTASQAEAARSPNPGHWYHPWYPVLTIGTDKARLYTRALVADIVSKESHLADPAWLLRVGIYLELLTCLGIFDAVRGEVGDLLTPDERRAYERSMVFAHVRPRVNAEQWKQVWATRNIVFHRPGVPRAGPVSSANLLQKKWATLTFLHAHHEDLRHAIELAGANRHNGQETWQRVFRDAERAVIRKTADSFPELTFLPAPMRELVLWNPHGIAGQQGLFAIACTQYRASMNAVADWAKQRGLMDYTGAECIPTRVSLLDARMNRPERDRSCRAATAIRGTRSWTWPPSSALAWSAQRPSGRSPPSSKPCWRLYRFCDCCRRTS